MSKTLEILKCIDSVVVDLINEKNGLGLELANLLTDLYIELFNVESPFEVTKVKENKVKTTIIITAYYQSVFGYEDSHSVTVTSQQYDAAYAVEAEYRSGNTSYMSSLDDETCAKLTGTSSCNCSYSVRKHHVFSK